MCDRLFNSIIFNFVFFFVIFAGLVSSSGAALRLGGLIMNTTTPKDVEYSYYASESGFSIGVKSAAILQWLTAGMIVIFARVNVLSTDRRLCDRFISIYCQYFLIVSLFGALHYSTLPIVAQSEADCTNFQDIINDEPRNGNPLCNADHSWMSLYTAFAAGSSIFFAGCLLLQTIYYCFQAICETTANTEPAEIAIPTHNVTTIIEMMPVVPTVNLASSPRISL